MTSFNVGQQLNLVTEAYPKLDMPPHWPHEIGSVKEAGCLMLQDDSIHPAHLFRAQGRDNPTDIVGFTDPA